MTSNITQEKKKHQLQVMKNWCRIASITKNKIFTKVYLGPMILAVSPAGANRVMAHSVSAALACTSGESYGSHTKGMYSQCECISSNISLNLQILTCPNPPVDILETDNTYWRTELVHNHLKHVSVFNPLHCIHMICIHMLIRTNQAYQNLVCERQKLPLQLLMHTCTKDNIKQRNKCCHRPTSMIDVIPIKSTSFFKISWWACTNIFSKLIIVTQWKLNTTMKIGNQSVHY